MLHSINVVRFYRELLAADRRQYPMRPPDSPDVAVRCENELARQSWGGMMIVTIANVADFEQFLRTFSNEGVEKRREHGISR
jgi:hypothetical protein